MVIDHASEGELFLVCFFSVDALHRFVYLVKLFTEYQAVNCPSIGGVLSSNVYILLYDTAIQRNLLTIDPLILCILYGLLSLLGVQFLLFLSFYFPLSNKFLLLFYLLFSYFFE